ncbi:MAG TPA: TRAP transporter substrate-binding protein DctP, partial [Clostridiaceae bacterium]|nr:TRAP transporter substrate-binding protein DctP [Clostridiaceae bacterium]
MKLRRIKRILSGLLATSLIFVAASCGGSDNDTSDDSATDAAVETSAADADAEKDSSGDQPQVVLKLNSVKSSSDKMYGKWEAFCDRITEASEGTVKVEIYPSETLGKTTDMIEAISKGAAVLQDCDTTHLADYVPDYSVFMHPYLIQEPSQIETLWKSDLGQDLEEQLEAQGLHVVTIVYFGTRNLISNAPVESREDTVNMKIRCASTKMWNEVAKVLGGNPTNTPWSETYNALSQGVADAAESPYSLLYSAKL